MAKKNSDTLQNSPFKSGTMVEVSLYDDGFWGSWYTGTVIRCVSFKTPNKYLVQYDKLFKDESGKKPLKEVLDVFQLRPVAPREKRRVFKFSDEVDAYYKDGWWEGVITEECGDGKFAVFFRSTKEQIVFGEEDMRLHRKWVDGKWKPPLEEEKVQPEKVEDAGKVRENSPLFIAGKPNRGMKRKISNSAGVSLSEEVERTIFAGAEIEVSSEEDGFQGAWFSAAVVECMGNKRYLVEYQRLRTEDDSGPLREEIESVHVRPCPPATIVIDRFKVTEEVDAFYNDGWWAGVIAKVLTESRYTVYFRTTGEEMKFVHSELRPHQDWIGGKWILPSQVKSSDLVGLLNIVLSVSSHLQMGFEDVISSAHIVPSLVCVGAVMFRLAPALVWVWKRGMDQPRLGSRILGQAIAPGPSVLRGNIF